MADSSKKQWGGKRAGAGRPRNHCIAGIVAETGHSRSRVYRGLRNVRRLTPEAVAFASDHANGKFITSKALGIAGEFEDAEAQIATLKLAIELRKARKQMSLVHAILNWERLRGEADPTNDPRAEHGADVAQGEAKAS
jgi:hypothetical protein